MALDMHIACSEYVHIICVQIQMHLKVQLRMYVEKNGKKALV